MNTGTKPPRGAVVITVTADGGREKHSAWCHNCGWSYANWGALGRRAAQALAPLPHEGVLMTTFKPGDKVTWGDDDVVYEVWSKHSKPGWLWLTRDGRSRPIEARAKNLVRVAHAPREGNALTKRADVTPMRAPAAKRSPMVTEEQRRAIHAAIMCDAADHDGQVDPNRVRARLTVDGALTVPARALSAAYSALAARGVLRSLGFVGVNDDRNGNAGKPQRNWQWVGPLPGAQPAAS